MKPAQMIMLLGVGLGIVYFMSRKTTAAATGGAMVPKSALNTIQQGYEWSAAENETLRQQLIDANNRASVFQSAYESTAK